MSGNAMIFPSAEDCLKPAPEPYNSFMRAMHLLTVPLYVITIYVLVLKSPKYLEAYRNHILFHTIGNIIFEIYFTIFMLPVTYLPHPVFRGAGLVKYFDLGGLTQFYLLVICIITIFNSMIGMFKYRFDTVMKENHVLTRRFNISCIFFRILTIFIPIFGIANLPSCTPNQRIFKEILWNTTQGVNFNPEIFCHTTVMSPPLTDHVFLPIIVMISLAFVQSVVMIVYCVRTISRKLEKSASLMSIRTVQMQKMLLLSLMIQTSIHAVFFGGPLIVFVYTLVFTLNYDGVAMVFLVFVSYHGAFSTVGMMGFTRPFRKEVVNIFYRNSQDPQPNLPKHSFSVINHLERTTPVFEVRNHNEENKNSQ